MYPRYVCKNSHLTWCPEHANSVLSTRTQFLPARLHSCFTAKHASYLIHVSKAFSLEPGQQVEPSKRLEKASVTQTHAHVGRVSLLSYPGILSSHQASGSPCPSLLYSILNNTTTNYTKFLNTNSQKICFLDLFNSIICGLIKFEWWIFTMPKYSCVL